MGIKSRMSDPYERVKGGRLAFKGGTLATRTDNPKKRKKGKKKKDKNPNDEDETLLVIDKQGDGSESAAAAAAEGEEEEAYTIDAAKRMKYEQLFPVEAKKFGYEPKTKTKTNSKSVEEALDDRVKKKADRYCK